MSWQYSYHYQDQEYDIPEQRTHCRYCGSFLTKDPTRMADVLWVVSEWVEVKQEDGSPYHIPETRPATEGEIQSGKAWKMVEGGPEWDCPHCGHTYDADEMFD